MFTPVGPFFTPQTRPAVDEVQKDAKIYAVTRGANWQQESYTLKSQVSLFPLLIGIKKRMKLIHAKVTICFLHIRWVIPFPPITTLTIAKTPQKAIDDDTLLLAFKSFSVNYIESVVNASIYHECTWRSGAKQAENSECRCKASSFNSYKSTSSALPTELIIG